jgi:hypothetical protein
MRPGFELQIPLVRVFTVVVLECPFDVNRVSVEALNEVGMVAVHGPDEKGQGN